MNTNVVQKGTKGSWKDLRLFLKTIKLNWGLIILAIIASVIHFIIAAVLPADTAALFDGSFEISKLISIVFVFIGLIAAEFVADIALYVAREKSACNARIQLWRRMMNVKTKYFDEHDASNILTTITADVNTAVQGFVNFLILIPSVLAYMLMLSGINGKMMIIVYIMLPIFLLYGLISGRLYYSVSRDTQIRIGGLTGYLADRMRNLSVIKSFSTEKAEKENGNQTSEKLFEIKKKNVCISTITNAIPTLLTTLGTILTVIFGCYYIRRGEIDITEWLTIFLTMPMFTVVMLVLVVQWNSFKSFQGLLYRICRMLEAPQEQLAGNQEIPEGDITFDHVDFAYADDKKVISDVSFTIPDGKVTALVGPTGCGKTTVLKLLERLYDVNDGAIRIGDTPISGVNLHIWRQNISYVAQESLMFGGSVRSALTYGVKREVSDEELNEVMRKTGIYSLVIDQFGGLDGELASWGSSMSGGQRQRFVIAREVLKNANVLIFDEPTSALDVAMAAEIKKLIFDNFKGKTVILVTHELNMIVGADQIVMLDNGKVIGKGRHEELMNSCQEYKELVEEQSLKEVYLL